MGTKGPASHASHTPATHWRYPLLRSLPYPPSPTPSCQWASSAPGLSFPPGQKGYSLEAGSLGLKT